AQRLAQQRVVHQVDLPDRQVVRRPPPRVDPRQLPGVERPLRLGRHPRPHVLDRHARSPRSTSAPAAMARWPYPADGAGKQGGPHPGGGRGRPGRAEGPEGRGRGAASGPVRHADAGAVLDAPRGPRRARGGRAHQHAPLPQDLARLADQAERQVVEEEVDRPLPGAAQHLPRLVREPRFEVAQVALQEDVRPRRHHGVALRARDAGDDRPEVDHGVGPLAPALVALQGDDVALHVPSHQSTSRSRGDASRRTLSRAAAASSASRAAFAMPRHSSTVWVARACRTAGRQAGAIDRLVTPRPASTSASRGSPAASPHTPTGRPVRRPPSATAATRSSSAGCQTSSRSARADSVRSAAKAYWARSLVPMLAKSQRSSSWAARIAAAGTSTIAATVASPRERAWSANCSASAGVDTIGAITHTSAPQPDAACAIAVSWSASSSGRRRASRSPRTPSAGFASSAWPTNGNGLSAPASMVWITTFRPANASNSAR